MRPLIQNPLHVLTNTLTVFLCTATALFLVVLAAIVLNIRENHVEDIAPNCPTEDSCQPIYDGQDDEWEIVETEA